MKWEMIRLGDVCEVDRGTRVVKNQLKQTSQSGELYPVFQNSLKPLGYHTKYNQPGKTMFMISAASAGQLAYSMTPYWAADDCFCFSSEHLNYHFLYFALLNMQESIFRLVRKGTIPRLAREAINALQIPFPPLSIQRRIAADIERRLAIVEKAKQAAAAQMEAAKALKAAYLRKVFGENAWQMVKLGDVCKIDRGTRVVKNQLKQTSQDGELYPVFQNSLKPLGYHSESNQPGKTVYMISAASAGQLAYSKTPYWAADDCFCFSSEHLSYHFLYFALLNIQNSIFRLVRKGTIPRLSREAISTLQVPLPPLPAQRRAAAYLDAKFAAADNLIAALDAQLADINAMPAAILRLAF